MKKLLTASLLAALSFSTFGRLAWPADDPCVRPVSSQQGLIRGKADPENQVCAWKGIPYAATPVGDLRFRATQPPNPHPGVLDAYEFGPACPQEPSLLAGGEIQSCNEDCLTLNIWSPQKPGRYPVMVWIHGGGFINGSGSIDLYHGAVLSGQKDVVVVTLNYRLGALGFLSLPELVQEDPNGSAGNYGILDQIQALKWVQQNIAAFQGDPGNVTIFGQSAGGGSVTMLLISPLTQGLFQHAIPMSGAMNVIGKKEKGYERGRELVKQLGCEGKDLLPCLREKPADAFPPRSALGKIPSFSGMAAGFSPKVDGYVITCQPIECLEQGSYNRVPVMLGYTRDEMKFFTIAAPYFKYLPRFMVNKLIRKMNGEAAEEARALYSYSDYKRSSDLFLAMITDYFTGPGFADAEALSQRTPVYFYRFEWDHSKYGAFHGLDIPFVFGNRDIHSKIAKKVQAESDRADAVDLAELMMAYYTNFAKTGDPNEPGLLDWPRFTTEKKEIMYFDLPITVAPISEKDLARYEFFAGQSRKSTD